MEGYVMDELVSDDWVTVSFKRKVKIKMRWPRLPSRPPILRSKEGKVGSFSNLESRKLLRSQAVFFFQEVEYVRMRPLHRYTAAKCSTGNPMQAQFFPFKRRLLLELGETQHRHMQPGLSLL